MKDSKYLDEILTELKVLMIRKNQDYGPYNIAHAPGGPMNGLIVRMHDKMTRLEHLGYSRKTDTPNYESIEDTLKDLANYAIIGLMVQRGMWEGADGTRRGVHN